MKPKLILTGAEAWTGKSACTEIFFHRLDNCAWLEGDEVWHANPSITTRILERITGVDYDLLLFTLIWDKIILTERARLRDAQANPRFVVLDQTRKFANTIQIDAGKKKPGEIAEQMFSIVHGK